MLVVVESAMLCVDESVSEKKDTQLLKSSHPLAAFP
jgi:hypothetical protein